MIIDFLSDSPNCGTPWLNYSDMLSKSHLYKAEKIFTRFRWFYLCLTYFCLCYNLFWFYLLFLWLFHCLICCDVCTALCNFCFGRCYVNKVVLIINIIKPTKKKYYLWEVQDKSVCLPAQGLAMHCRGFGYNACCSFVSLFWVAATHKVFVCVWLQICSIVSLQKYFSKAYLCASPDSEVRLLSISPHAQYEHNKWLQQSKTCFTV